MPPKSTDRPPSLVQGAPVEHLEPVSRLSRPQPRNRRAGILPQERVTVSVLANSDATPLLFVECLDPALDEV